MAQTLFVQIVKVIVTCTENGLVTELLRNRTRTLEFRILLQITLLELILIVFAQNGKIVLRENLVNQRSASTVLGKVLQRLRNIRTGTVRTMSAACFNMRLTRGSVSQKLRVDADDRRNFIYKRQQLIELLRGDYFILCTRI